MIVILLNIILVLTFLTDRAVHPTSIHSEYVSVKHLTSEINTEFIMLTGQNIKGDWYSLKLLEYFNPLTNKWCIEQWLPIKDYEKRYEISNCGRVKSLAKSWVCGTNRTCRNPDMIMSKNLDGHGYYYIILYNNSIPRIFKIQHLVWDHFGDERRNGYIRVVDHKDEDKTNNCILNLQLLSNRENVSKSFLVNKKSNYPTGVTYQKHAKKKYRAQIKINGKWTEIGYYNNPEDAGIAYQTKLNSLK